MRNLLVGLLVVISTNISMAQGKPLNLMPIPSSISQQEGRFLLTSAFSVSIHGDKTDSVLYKAANRMYQTLNRRTSLFFNTQYIRPDSIPAIGQLIITVKNASVAMIGLDESYTLFVTPQKIQLDAATSEGALHGLETILQLVSNDGGKFYLPTVEIQDSPRFRWRGLMLDVARHFIPVDGIKRNIDAMAAVKLNVLHWHLSDDEGFRAESKVFPLLHVKGSNGDFYTQTEIKDIVQYARSRGIMVVPEFDVPGHTRSWFAGYPSLASAPGPYTPGPRFDFSGDKPKGLMEIMKVVNSTPTPTIDPSKEETFTFLDKFFGEMSTLFPAPYIHMGCDENNGVVWMNNPSIVAFMKKSNMADAHALLSYFGNRVQKILAKHNKHAIGWEEILSGSLSKDVTVQVWRDANSIKKAVENGNHIVVSFGFYLDSFMPAYIHYNNDVIQATLSDSAQRLIYGGEAALWTEAVDKNNFEIRAWPRVAAVAERLWSPATIKDVDDMYRRLFAISSQLDELGLQHISNYEKGLRRLASGLDITPLKNLTDVLAPGKGYKRLFARMTKAPGETYQTAPLTAVADIIPCDAMTKRVFRSNVAEFLTKNDTKIENKLEQQLIKWRDNDVLLQSYFQQSSPLADIKQHSANLHDAAVIGLAAIAEIKSSAQPNVEWQKEQLKKLSEYKKSFGETELDIIPEIEGLVNRRLSPEPTSFPIL